jgi:hypothetical protein
MKTIAFAFLAVIQFAGAADVAEDSKPAIETPSTTEKPSPSLLLARDELGADILNALEEVPLGDEKLDDDRPCYRIFAGVGGKMVTLLKWYVPLRDQPESMVVGSQILKKDGKWQIVSKTSNKLTGAQRRLLEKLSEQLNLKTLPNKDWIPDDRLSGSTWIYEIPVYNGYLYFNRWSPITLWDKKIYDDTKVTPDRLVRENQLSALTLMLWTIANLNPDE